MMTAITPKKMALKVLEFAPDLSFFIYFGGYHCYISRQSDQFFQF